MFHILTSGKYYFLSIAAHVIFITLFSVFVFAPSLENSLQTQGGQEKIIKVSFNKNSSPALNKFQHANQTMYEVKNNSEGKESKEEISRDGSGMTSETSSPANFSAHNFKKASLLVEIIPDYPMQAVKRGIEGTVLIDANIDSIGRVSKTEIVVSSNYDILDKAAIKSVKKARFAPASYMGSPTPDTLRIAINFSLKE